MPLSLHGLHWEEAVGSDGARRCKPEQLLDIPTAADGAQDVQKGQRTLSKVVSRKSSVTKAAHKYERLKRKSCNRHAIVKAGEESIYYSKRSTDHDSRLHLDERKLAVGVLKKLFPPSKFLVLCLLNKCALHGINLLACAINVFPESLVSSCSVNENP